jgi:hypothetical protein
MSLRLEHQFRQIEREERTTYRSRDLGTLERQLETLRIIASVQEAARSISRIAF